MRYNAFAATGKQVSVLGLGTVKFGRNQRVNYPCGEGFTLPSDHEIEALLDLALLNGINLLDTAPAYGTSEERLGNLLGARRDRFFLVTKTGEEFDGAQSEYIFTANHTRLSVERSLKRLQTDRLDCVLVHSSRDDLRVITETPALETLSALRQEGKILSLGVSVSTVEGGKKAVDLSDAVMVAYNMRFTVQREVINYAREKGKAILVKKGLASGYVTSPDDAQESVRFVTETPGVTSLVFGSLNPRNILENIKALNRPTA
jgi:aryl-alcohol dehydrogenase-like predicted oxidoreductase